MTIDRGRMEIEAGIYIATFAARTDAYSTWTGEHWSAVREELTPDVVIEAFRSKRPVSGYTIAADSTTHVAALDVDLESGLLVCDRVARLMTSSGCPAYVEPSRRGAHLWAILSDPLPAIVVRRSLRAFLQHAHIDETNPKIELRPGQDRLLDPNGLGNALRLPLMPHPATRQRAPLLRPGGKILATKIGEACLEVETVPAALFAEWAEKWVPRIDPRDLPPWARKPKRYGDDQDDTLTATSLLLEAGVTGAVRPGRAVRCPFHDDKHPSLSIAKDDRRVFCKSPSCEAFANGRGLGTHQLRALLSRRVPVAS
jgi:hypothetical protein